jgi:3-hydroxymyristoyl/3-hydroxydecanoyl-(acyl carrier protein) dehydratase
LFKRLIISRDEISSIIHINDPFLMIDGVLELNEGRSLKAYLDVRNDKWFFSCHLSDEGVMPATLIIEGMLQSMVLLIYKSFRHDANISFITKIDSKILSPVRPGDNISYEANILSLKRGIFKGGISTKLDGKEIAWAEVVYASPHMYYSNQAV